MDAGTEKPIKASDLKALLERQGFKCAYTGLDLTPESASLDHVIPLGRGGSHAVENLAIVRHDVNLAKRTMTYDEFVSMCREVVSYADKDK